MIKKDCHLAIGSIVFANIITILGVIFFDWSMLQIILIYWCECGIIALISLLKIIISKIKLSSKLYESFTLFVFYIFFAYIHYFIINVVFNNGTIFFNLKIFLPIIIPIISIFISHAISFINDYASKKKPKNITKNEYIERTTSEIINRIIAVQICLLAGGLVIQIIGRPVIIIIFLIIAKIIIDIDLHLKSHGKNRLFKKILYTPIKIRLK